MKHFRQALLALQFLTIFPVKVSGALRHEDLADSMRYYPLIGALLGALSVIAFLGALRWFSPAVAVVAAVVTLIISSGALHLEGFADMCDGFYGFRDRERVLAIMKDSRSGPMAIVGIFCLLALKLVLLARVDPGRAFRVLILAPALGRLTMVWLCATSVYARPEGGTGSAYIGRVDHKTFWIATCFGAALSFSLLHARGLWVMGGAAIFTWAFGRYTKRRIGGNTGDTLGGCSELIEVLVLVSS